MAKTTRQNITFLFWAIAVLSLAASIFFIKTIFLFFFAVEFFGALGLALRWFEPPLKISFLRTKMVKNFLYWFAGILGSLGIFDVILRLMQKSLWRFDQDAAILLDAAVIVLFLIWQLLSHLIKKDSKERKVCEFC